MASIKTVTIVCDIKGCGQHASNTISKLSVIFNTEQTEGRSCEPYISNQDLDLCPDHMREVLGGKMIKASGAQGHNIYYL